MLKVFIQLIQILSQNSAKKIDKVSYEEMLEMSSTGAKVLQTRSVELAMKNNLHLQVLSSINKKKEHILLMKIN